MVMKELDEEKFRNLLRRSSKYSYDSCPNHQSHSTFTAPSSRHSRQYLLDKIVITYHFQKPFVTPTDLRSEAETRTEVDRDLRRVLDLKTFTTEKGLISTPISRHEPNVTPKFNSGDCSKALVSAYSRPSINSVGIDIRLEFNGFRFLRRKYYPTFEDKDRSGNVNFIPPHTEEERVQFQKDQLEALNQILESIQLELARYGFNYASPSVHHLELAWDYYTRDRVQDAFAKTISLRTLEPRHNENKTHIRGTVAEGAVKSYRKFSCSDGRDLVRFELELKPRKKARNYRQQKILPLKQILKKHDSLGEAISEILEQHSIVEECFQTEVPESMYGQALTYDEWMHLLLRQRINYAVASRIIKAHLQQQDFKFGNNEQHVARKLRSLSVILKIEGTRGGYRFVDDEDIIRLIG